MADQAAVGAASSGKIVGGAGGNSHGFGAAIGAPVYQSNDKSFSVGVGIQGGGAWNKPSISGVGIGLSKKF